MLPMITDVKANLAAKPFEPFVIIMTSGQRYPVPTAEHAGLNPEKTRVIVWLDNGVGVHFPSLHISSIEKGNPKIL